MNTRLKQFIAAENISQSQFADTIKVVRASVSHVLSGRNYPSYDFIKAIMSAYPNLNIEWLMMGKGKMYKDQVSASDGDLFVNDEIFAPEPAIIPPVVTESVRTFEPVQENLSVEPIFTSDKEAEKPVIQRKVSKVLIFFDDGTYQEMGY